MASKQNERDTLKGVQMDIYILYMYIMYTCHLKRGRGREPNHAVTRIMCMLVVLLLSKLPYHLKQFDSKHDLFFYNGGTVKCKKDYKI